MSVPSASAPEVQQAVAGAVAHPHAWTAVAAVTTRRLRTLPQGEIRRPAPPGWRRPDPRTVHER